MPKIKYFPLLTLKETTDKSYQSLKSSFQYETHSVNKEGKHELVNVIKHEKDDDVSITSSDILSDTNEFQGLNKRMRSVSTFFTINQSNAPNTLFIPNTPSKMKHSFNGNNDLNNDRNLRLNEELEESFSSSSSSSSESSSCSTLKRSESPPKKVICIKPATSKSNHHNFLD